MSSLVHFSMGDMSPSCECSSVVFIKVVVYIINVSSGSFSFDQSYIHTHSLCTSDLSSNPSIMLHNGSFSGLTNLQSLYVEYDCISCTACDSIEFLSTVYDGLTQLPK